MILALLAILAGSPAAAGTATVVTIRSRTIVRVPARHPTGVAPPMPRFKERRGPHCIAAADISAAAVTGAAQVDFALRGGDRIRAMLGDECPALDFYRGFYLSPSTDGKICADRDMIRTRAGGECAIDKFRKLIPVVPPDPAAKGR